MKKLLTIKEQFDIAGQIDFYHDDSGYELNDKYYKASSLVKQAEEEGNNVFDYDLRCLPLQIRWNNLDPSLLAHVIDRVEKADLKYPVIFSPNGTICDGYHRITKAILKGKNTVKAIRLISYPKPDEILNNENDSSS